MCACLFGMAPCRAHNKRHKQRQMLIGTSGKNLAICKPNFCYGILCFSGELLVKFRDMM